MSEPAERSAERPRPRAASRRRSRGERARRSAGWPLLALIAAAALVGAVIWSLSERSSGGAESTAAAPTPVLTATAAVERRTLIETERLRGTLEFADNAPLVAEAAGTITSLAAEGSPVARGAELYRLSNQPAIVLSGTIPAYRTLERGIDPGPDVFQLEFNLVELGYDPDDKIVLDGTFNKHTEAAVERWQAATGATEDGIVELGEAVFLIGERRISQHRAQVRDMVQPGSPILELSAPLQVVKLDLPADRQDLLAVGDTVSIELPGDERVAGTVLELGRVATSTTLLDGTRTEPVIDVTIPPDKPLTDSLDQAPVDIFVAKRAAEGVLAVPVTALVAVKGGGYAVEVAEGAETRLVRVEPGLFADGLVEIAGDVSEGTRVVVPR